MFAGKFHCTVNDLFLVHLIMVWKLFVKNKFPVVHTGGRGRSGISLPKVVSLPSRIFIIRMKFRK